MEGGSGPRRDIVSLVWNGDPSRKEYSQGGWEAALNREMAHRTAMGIDHEWPPPPASLV